jgi:hypothetical protein
MKKGEDNDELGLVVIFSCKRYDDEMGACLHLLMQKTTMGPNLSLSSCVLSVTYRR